MRKRLLALALSAGLVLGVAAPAAAGPWPTHYHNWAAMTDNCTTHSYVSDGAGKRHRVTVVTVYFNSAMQPVGCDLRAQFQQYLTAKQAWVTVDYDYHYY